MDAVEGECSARDIDPFDWLEDVDAGIGVVARKCYRTESGRYEIPLGDGA
jgi:hypothetical protein